MRELRNFVLRLSIDYLVLYALLALKGVSREQQLFGVWIVALVFTVLTVTVRRLLLSLTLPLIIMTGGLFIFIVDGIVLVLTAALTRLNITNFWWALLGVLVMSTATNWVERGFQAIGWLRDEEEGGAQNVMTHRSPPWWLVLILLVILIFGIGFSGAMAVQVFLAVSTITTNIQMMTAAAGISFAVFTWGIAWLVAEGLALARRARFSTIISGVATLVVVGSASVLILASDPVPLPPPVEPRAGTAYWELTTGSRIAYTYVPAAGGATTRNPIVFLHGGPGWAVLDTDVAFFGRFADHGFDVYLYDQVGSGLSGRLDDVEAYTISRHAEDLEAIRETIDADRLILVGHAEGSELAARYMIEHRDRVERVVFYSPTPLWNDRLYFRDETRTAAFLAVPETTLLEIRPIVAMAIAAYSPRSAQAYVSQAEMTAWADRVTDERVMVCPGDAALAPDPVSPGYNPYAQVVGNVSANRPPDPRPALKQLLIPTILLRGDCGPVDADVVVQYQDAIPYTKAYYVEAAGSMLHLSRPDTIEDIVVAFLHESP